MGKVFRIYGQGNNNIEDWAQVSNNPYTTQTIAQIKDPNGATPSKEITSIPSPFARIDLVKSAFREVVDSGNLDGNTIFHKMVSDSLDVGEIFFNYIKLKNKINIIPWNKTAEMANLQSVNPTYHDALDKYLISDAAQYNFGDMTDLYLLDYVGPGAPAVHNIVGSTSPATLFFSNANDLSYVTNNITFGTDKPFDAGYQPLYKRDFEYVKSWFLYRVLIPNFATLFPEVDSYLSLTANQFQNNLPKMGAIRNLTNASVADYTQISVGGSNVNLLGTDILGKANVIPKNSDFEINSHLKIGNGILVLPVTQGNKYSQLLYNTDIWGDANFAPFQDSNPLSNRRLPNDGAPYPYLTISDFLEDTIICVPKNMNGSAFFDGNFDKAGNGYSYLLPIKDLFFKYFDLAELQGKMKDGKKMLELQSLAGDSVKVVLRIPIKGNQIISYIEYERIYYSTASNISENEGGMESMTFAMALYPSSKSINKDSAFYSAAVVPESGDSGYVITYMQGNQSLKEQVSSFSGRKDGIQCTENYVLRGSNFDYLRLEHNGISNVILPKLVDSHNADVYRFSVDLGTSNTHVEYSLNGGPSMPLDITSKDIQLAHLFESDEDIDLGVFDKDFIPKQIDDEYHFPVKTVYSVVKTRQATVALVPFGNSNIPFTYYKRKNEPWNNYNTNIKWDVTAGSKDVIEAYIENLALILRNKVLCNGGDINKAEIVWFYPTSMSQNQFSRMKDAWNTVFIKYFAGVNVYSRLKWITEAVAPCEFFTSQSSASSYLLSIDIGGGTSDAVYYSAVATNNDNVQFITSFRFAANALFGSGIGGKTQQQNKMVSYYLEHISPYIIDESQSSELSDLLGDYKASCNYSDIAQFLFSLVDSKAIKNNNTIKIDDVDFNKLLGADSDYKVVFILFYAAIICHLACIIKSKNLKEPRHIAFSGNGSKLLRILSTDNVVIENFTKVLFEKFMGRQYDENGLQMQLPDNPKELTCKGGLLSQNSQKFSDAEKAKVILCSKDNASFVSSGLKYKEINEDYLQKVKVHIDKFVDLMEQVDKEFSFENNFGARKDSVAMIKNANKDILTFLQKGIKEHIAVDPDAEVDETLFFYPIIGMIGNIINAVEKN